MNTQPYAFEMSSRENIESEINRKIRNTVKIAYEHSPLYKEKFDQLGIKPDDIRDRYSLMKSIQKGLRLTGKELITKFDSLRTDFSDEFFVKELWSSGSTGVPKRIWYGPDDFKRSNEQVSLVYNAMGLHTGDNVLNLFSPSPNASGPLSERAADHFGLHTLKVSVPMKTDNLLKIMELYRPKSLFAISTRAHQLSEEVQHMGENIGKIGVESILIGGETCTMEKKRTIERGWNDIFVTDVWASSECSVMGYFSKNCKDYRMHIAENRLLFDCVDPNTLDAVGSEEKGMDLLSTLYDVGEKPSVILLGYSHGDSVKLLDSDSCDCGRKYKMIEWPVARNDYTTHLAGQNLNPILGTESAIFGFPDLVTGEYVCVYAPSNGEKSIPYLEIRVETKKPISKEQSVVIEEKIRSHSISNPAAFYIVASQSSFVVKFMEAGHLFDGLENYKKPGKPIRLIKA